MEYVYALTGARRAVLYDEGNHIMLAFIGKARSVQWTAIEHDYRLNLVSCLYRDEIYISYMSVANELVLKKVGDDEKLVVFSDPNNALDVRKISLNRINDSLYIMYVITNVQTGADEIWCIQPYSDRRGKKLIIAANGISEYKIFEYANALYLTYKSENGDSEYIYKPDINATTGNGLNEYVLLEKNTTHELEKHYKEHEEEYIKQYKEQYNDLVNLTKQIQDEGKKWRDLYHRSIKKENKKTSDLKSDEK